MKVTLFRRLRDVTRVAESTGTSRTHLFATVRRDAASGGPIRSVAGCLVSASACRPERMVPQALGALPHQDRFVVVQMFYRRRSVDEIADVLGVSADSVRWRCYEALRALRQELAARGITM